MTSLYAYSFRSPLSLSQVLGRFRELGPWRWIERDNDGWGEYISARALDDPHEGMVKVIRDSERYIINVYLVSDEPSAAAEFEAVRATILRRLLPAIRATDVTETDDLES